MSIVIIFPSPFLLLLTVDKLSTPCWANASLSADCWLFTNYLIFKDKMQTFHSRNALQITKSIVSKKCYGTCQIMMIISNEWIDALLWHQRLPCVGWMKSYLESCRQDLMSRKWLILIEQYNSWKHIFHLLAGKDFSTLFFSPSSFSSCSREKAMLMTNILLEVLPI